MSQVSAAALILLVLLAGCGNRMRTQEKVQEAIINRLQTRSGLDLNSLDVTTTSVAFNKNKAYATVAFHPKGDASVNSGMMMKYTLEVREGKWVVIDVSDSQGHGMLGRATANDSSLPPGHPPVSAVAGPPHEAAPPRPQ